MASNESERGSMIYPPTSLSIGDVLLVLWNRMNAKKMTTHYNYTQVMKNSKVNYD